MIEISGILFLGVAIFFGFFLGKATHVVRLTAIVGYIIAGIVLGPVTGLVELGHAESGFIVNMTLAFVAFIIGVGFTKQFFRQTGSSVIKITFVESLITSLFVGLGVFLITRDLPISIILAALGPATAPAGTVAALRECKARGRFSKIVVGIVGFDDAVAVLIFVIGLAVVRVIMGGSISVTLIFEAVFLEIVLAVALGIVMGMLLTLVNKWLNDRTEMYISGIMAVMLCAGISQALGASLIMSCMVLGVVFINLEPHKGKVIRHTVEGVLPVLFLIFFVTAGMELHPALLIKVGFIGAGYIGFRILGKLIGGFSGSKLAQTTRKTQRFLGFALLSQAGVAIGLSLLVSHEIRGLDGGAELGVLAVTVITATTVIFEIIGPLGVKFAVRRIQGGPRTQEQKTISKMKRTADEIDIIDCDINEDIVVYDEEEEDDAVYTKEKGHTRIEKV